MMKYSFVILISLSLFLSLSIHAQIFEFPPQQTWRLTLINQNSGFNELTAASIDPIGNVYLLDHGANMLFRINRSGHIEGTVGGYGWGNQEFDRPVDVWAENGVDVFVADYGNHRIQRFDRRLVYVATLETRTTGFEIERFGYPVGVAMNRQGELFVLDEENFRIVVFGRFDSHLRTTGGIDAGRFRISNPRKIRIFGDDLVMVQDGKRILFFDQFGNPFREFSSRVLPPYKDFCVFGSDMFFLLDNSIDIYRGDLIQPFERINLEPYFAEPQKLQHIAVSRNRVVLMSKDQAWIFRLLR